MTWPAVPDGVQSEVWTDRHRDLLRAAGQLLDTHVMVLNSAGLEFPAGPDNH